MSVKVPRSRAVAAALIVLTMAGAGGIAAPSVPSSDRAIVQALNRLTFGPREGDLERIRAVGLATWIEQQLNPARIDDTAMRARLAGYDTLTLDSARIAREYFLPAQEARRARQQASTAQDPNPDQAAHMRPDDVPAEVRRGRLPQRELAEAKILRAVYSERQLEEVLVDFWFNHFNVFAGKGRTAMYLTEYERDDIRPHVFGTFRELLEATAKSPAMLFYLDNWMSADPNGTPHIPGRPNGRPRTGVNRPSGPAVPQPQGAKARARQPRGLNENYARELLELHTLGVDGGYSQKDVIEVARAFTGWTIAPPGQGGFRFAPALHDRGEKHVLGQTIKAGGGIEDGERVLDILARHPSTARHVAAQLARRFVSDTPPESVVALAARRFADTGGDLRDVVRTIVTSPEFFAPEAQQVKVKTPLEFVASAVRASGAGLANPAATLRTLQQLGMMPYMCQPPTGYDDTAEAWVSPGALVTRMNFATQLASGRVPGISAPPPTTSHDLASRLGSPDFQRR